jgi:hypothetical protein
MRETTTLVPIALAIVALAAGCGSEDAQPSLNQVSDFVRQVGTSDGTGVASLRTGEAPATSGGPGISDTEEAASVVPGGSTSVPLTADREFSAVIVAVDGAEGYYELTLPSAAQSVELVLTISQNVPSDSFTVRSAVVDPSGLVGTYAATLLVVQDVGQSNSDVQVVLSWDVDSDLDLALTDPNGEEISFANPAGSTGGVLDLDSNPGCSIDGIRNESISYPSGQAPEGTYTAQVSLFDACGTESTKYVLTISRAGQAPETYVGSIAAEFNPSDHRYLFSFGEPDVEPYGMSDPRRRPTHHERIIPLPEGSHEPRTVVARLRWHKRAGRPDPYDAAVRAGDGVQSLFQVFSNGDQPFARVGLRVQPLAPDVEYELGLTFAAGTVQVELSQTNRVILSGKAPMSGVAELRVLEALSGRARLTFEASAPEPARSAGSAEMSKPLDTEPFRRAEVGWPG